MFVCPLKSGRVAEFRISRQAADLNSRKRIHVLAFLPISRGRPRFADQQSSDSIGHRRCGILRRPFRCLRFLHFAAQSIQQAHPATSEANDPKRREPEARQTISTSPPVVPRLEDDLPIQLWSAAKSDLLASVELSAMRFACRFVVPPQIQIIHARFRKNGPQIEHFPCRKKLSCMHA